MGRRNGHGGRETVLVTGAAGTVGSYVVRELCAAGYSVIASDREGARLDFTLPEDARLEVRSGDLTDLSFCVDVLAGATSVVHLAACVDLNLPEEAMRRVNVRAVEYLYQAARAAGCRRFVFFSSGAIYKKGAELLSEETPIEPHTGYERSKADAERYLLSMREHSVRRPDVVVLRPSMIYGPRARFLGAKVALLPPVMSLFLRRIPRLSGGAVCNWVHAEDVARAAVFLLREPHAAWQAYNVGDDEPLAFGEVFEIVTRAYGLPLGARVPVPTRLMQAVGPRIADTAVLVELLSLGQRTLWRRVVERENLVPAIDAALDRETFLYASTRAVFDTRKLKALGFSLKWKSLREGYPAVLRWFQEQRWLPVLRAS